MKEVQICSHYLSYGFEQWEDIVPAVNKKGKVTIVDAKRNKVVNTAYFCVRMR